MVPFRQDFPDNTRPTESVTAQEDAMSKPWTVRMPDDQFLRMSEILAASSPGGFEEAKVQVIITQLKPVLPKNWGVTRFAGGAGLVIDTHPDCNDMLTIAVAGHLDQIRLLVRSIDDAGRIWLGHAESFLPAVIAGSEAKLFCNDPKNPGKFLEIRGTIESVGAAHFVDPAVRAGEKGIKPEQLYFEPGLVGKNIAKVLKDLGVQVGDPVVFHRPIQRMLDPNVFQGAYLDNGLGCFVTAELARLIIDQGGVNIRVLFTFTTHEENDRLGARQIVAKYGNVLDAFIAVDVDHAYAEAPGIADKHHSPLTCGGGFTLGYGSFVNLTLNGEIEAAAKATGIPMQRDSLGRDTGTDAMAAVLGDVAPATVGFPIRCMHTSSELGYTGDVLAATHALYAFLRTLSEVNPTKTHFVGRHPNLNNSRLATLPTM